MNTVQKLEALPSIFNDEKGTVRLLLLLSPTCTECLRGASEIKEHVLEKIGNDDVRVYAVWLPILSADKQDRVVVATRRLADPRVRHFWDGAAKLSAEYPLILNFEDDRPGVDLYSLFRRLLALYNDLFQCASNALPAWDVYLLFDRRAEWQSEPPTPSFWMHQLTLSKAKRLKGPAFAREVIRLLADA
jgi:hypothetical protein